MQTSTSIEAKIFFWAHTYYIVCFSMLIIFYALIWFFVSPFPKEEKHLNTLIVAFKMSKPSQFRSWECVSHSRNISFSLSKPNGIKTYKKRQTQISIEYTRRQSFVSTTVCTKIHPSNQSTLFIHLFASSLLPKITLTHANVFNCQNSIYRKSNSTGSTVVQHRTKATITLRTTTIPSIRRLSPNAMRVQQIRLRHVRNYVTEIPISREKKKHIIFQLAKNTIFSRKDATNELLHETISPAQVSIPWHQRQLSLARFLFICVAVYMELCVTFFGCLRARCSRALTARLVAMCVCGTLAHIIITLHHLHYTQYVAAVACDIAASAAQIHVRHVYISGKGRSYAARIATTRRSSSIGCVRRMVWEKLRPHVKSGRVDSFSVNSSVQMFLIFFIPAETNQLLQQQYSAGTNELTPNPS